MSSSCRGDSACVVGIVAVGVMAISGWSFVSLREAETIVRDPA